MHFRIVNDEGRRAEIGVGLDDRCALLSSNVVCGPIVCFYQKTVLIGECMGCGDSVYIIGFTIALVMMGGFREILGTGSFLEYSLFGPNFEPWVVMILPPGGLLTLGFLLLLLVWYERRKARAAKREAGQDGAATPERSAA